MLKGYNLIGLQESSEGKKTLASFSTHTKNTLPEKFAIATGDEVDKAVATAVAAFSVYKNKSAEERALFLEAIADEIINLGNPLIQRATLESGLPEARLTGERARTVAQLRLFATILREGSWVEAVIDTALPDRKPLPRPDLRKLLVPIGPVAVFGASNFPFAFSTAGGDTVSALAAGNPVVIKAHDAHLGVNELVSSAIKKAVETCNMPAGVFSFVIGEGADTGIQLITHEGIKAVGFTGSYRAGMALYKAAVNDRKTPIPVFAEMSSTNPVLLLPGKIKENKTLAEQIAASITLSAGQFCTNPGLLFLMEDEASEKFIKNLTAAMAAMPSSTMLNPGICNNYYRGKQHQKKQEGVTVLYEAGDESASYKGAPFLSKVKAAGFIANPQLQNEVFGPSSLIVLCSHKQQLLQALQLLQGQLTATVHATETELIDYKDCIEILENKVGRILYNGVPTGVEVGYAMVHGGPYPATTNANSTSVGADAIKRFVRPLCFQDCPGQLLPEALQNRNTLNIMRKINGVFTKESL